MEAAEAAGGPSLGLSSKVEVAVKAQSATETAIGSDTATVLQIKQYVYTNASKNFAEKDPSLMAGRDVNQGSPYLLGFRSRWITFHSLHNGHTTFSCSFLMCYHILFLF